MKRVGFVQTNPEFGAVESNLKRALDLASKVESDLLVFPELFNTGYLFLSREEALKLSEGLDGPTIKRLSDFASEHSTAIVAGFPERDGRKVYNSAVAIDIDGDVKGVYRKTHLFYEEKLIFDPGDTGFRVFDLAGMRVGIMICFDWVFPESARSLALSGAQIIAHPSCLVMPYAPKADPVRAFENRVFIILSDRSGVEERGGKKLRYHGMSLISDPKMNILAQAPEEGEHVGIAEIDPKLAEDKRVNELNDIFLDRRPEFYGKIC